MKRLTPSRLAGTLGLLAVGLGVALLVGLCAGPSQLSPGQALRAVLDPAAVPDSVVDIVRRVRLPRVGLAALVGASLAVSGALFQALLRNPLADPFVLGVSGGAALGGVTAMGLGAGAGLGTGSVPVAAFAGAVAATGLLFTLAGGGGRLSATTLLLMGVVFNAFASAAIIFVASLAGLAQGARIFLWLIGNLSGARADAVVAVGLFLAIGFACVLPWVWKLNLLVLGDESASQLGVHVERLRQFLLLATSLMVGAAVSVSGLIGFVGLIVPHALRLLFGADHRLLVPAAALSGAGFLALCDTLARSLFPGRELPVGAITALLGGPLFLVLLRRQSRGGLLS